MNFKIISALLGFVAILLGVGMLVCTVWGLPACGGGSEERPACGALGISAFICFVVGLFFTFMGRGYDNKRIFLREAFACVSLCWILAILLGALPYILAGVQRREGVPFTICDAIFESASGLTTTGGTVFENLEDPKTLPRTILFWRCLTHFLGGLGVMCFFVVFLGKGASGKAVLKVERLFSGNLPFTKMRSLALSLSVIYLLFCGACFIWYASFGMSFYDAVCHAFSVASLGGFSTRNESVGYFECLGRARATAIEYGTILFMILSGINYWLLYWAARGRFDKLFKDAEWRFYVVSLSVVTLLTACFGLAQGDFTLKQSSRQDLAILEFPESETLAAVTTEITCSGKNSADTVKRPDCDSSNRSIICDGYESVFRKSLFHAASLMTSMGFATDRYDCWSASTILLFILVMLIGGCSGSPAGGIKVNRAILALGLLRDEPEKHFRPNVVKTARYGVARVDAATATEALKYACCFVALVVVVGFVATVIEPDALWSDRPRPQIEKLFDLMGGSLAMFGNTGLAFGEFGSAGNYASLTEPSKLLFSWAMIVGRLEIWCVLALFSKKFWNNR